MIYVDKYRYMLYVNNNSVTITIIIKYQKT